MRPFRHNIPERNWLQASLNYGIAWCLVAYAGGCKGHENSGIVDVVDGLPTNGDAAIDTDSCQGRDPGWSCAADRHCVHGDCVFNTCGDGVRADEEACDDGNLARGDGCSPSCALEIAQCDGSTKIGDTCADSATALVDAGTADARCPEPISIRYSKLLPRQINSANEATAPYLYAGDSVELRANSKGDTSNVLWVARPVSPAGQPWSSELFSSKVSASTTLTCSDTIDTQYELTFLWFLPGLTTCPQYPPDRIECRAQKPSFATDAGVDAGVEVDAGVVADAQVADAGVTRFRSAACEACVSARCANYSDIDLVGPCFHGVGFDDAFARACSEAYFCSHKATDSCGDNRQLGAVACFCGPVTIDQCQASADNVKGACKAEWYAATRCAATDQNCALNRFQDTTLPAGFATFLLECQQVACEAECAR